MERGKAWEREVARSLTQATGLNFSRSLCESRDGNVGDVRAPGVPLCIQAKAGQRPRIYEALEEAVQAAGPDELPVAAVKCQNGRGRPAERFAVLAWADFLELVAGFVRSEKVEGSG